MKTMWKKVAMGVALLGMLGLVGCGNANSGAAQKEVEETAQEAVENQGTQETEEASAQENEQEAQTDNQKIGLHHVEIVVKDLGTIALELDGDTAPISTQNFMDLANSGFYDGLTFHRIIDSFMIQGGDPLGNGTGGSDKTIKGEFAANGVENNISHKRGVISMARSQMMDSASSQFFIVHQDSEFLDGQYAAFGHVTSGIEVVDKICEITPVQDQNGTTLPQDQPVIEKVTVID